MNGHRNSTNLIFPNNFLWGSATSAFQIEGGFINNEWNDPSARGPVKDMSSPADSVHFWHYYDAYIALMKKMNHTVFRMSVEWARIEPEKDMIDDSALRHYRRIITALRNAGIRPIVDLHHHSNPLWIYNNGGWTDRQTAARFIRHVELVIQELGDLVDFWLTINEPVVYAAAAYLLGLFPPREKNIRLMYKCVRNLAIAHTEAYRTIHEVFSRNKWPRPIVSFAKHVRLFNPANPRSIADRFAAALRDRLFNRYFFNLINRETATLDMLCINYYTCEEVRFPFTSLTNDDLPKNKLGWDIYPRGLYEILMEYGERFRLPIFITENGVCDENDELRPSFLLDHIRQMHRAVAEGVPVRGYCHWSTMDNYEYSDGLEARFGLVHVDHMSRRKKCRLKPSGRLYGDIIKTNGITDAIIKKHLPDWRPR